MKRFRFDVFRFVGSWILVIAVLGCQKSATDEGEIQLPGDTPDPTVQAAGPFSILNAVEGDQEVTLTWEASANASTYTVHYGTSSGFYPTIFSSSATSPTTVTGLTNGTVYYFMVTAVNEQGTVPASTEFVRMPGPPTLSDLGDVFSMTKATAWSLALPFQLGGDPNLACTENVTAASSDVAVLPASGISITGTYPNCSLNLNFAASVTGSTILTLTATRGQMTATQTFSVQLVPLAAGVYSLRKLVLSSVAKAIQVRRASDNTLKDIGFSATGGLDVSDLSSFCAATSCFVRTWYDQSGNGKNAVQTAAANQARIVNAGVVDLKNSKPALIFDSNDYYTLSNAIAKAAGMSSVSVAERTSNASIRTIFSGAAGSFQFRYNNAHKLNLLRTNQVSLLLASAVSPLGLNVISTTTIAGNSMVATNGVGISNTTSPGFTSGITTIGRNGSNLGENFIGGLSEVTIFSIVLPPVHRQALEANQKTFYSTP
ncbi:MAG: arabinofuranosidase catalytic domain-containing protein [Pseudobdellovibrionaceae bacterium]